MTSRLASRIDRLEQSHEDRVLHAGRRWVGRVVAILDGGERVRLAKHIRNTSEVDQWLEPTGADPELAAVVKKALDDDQAAKHYERLLLLFLGGVSDDDEGTN